MKMKKKKGGRSDRMDVCTNRWLDVCTNRPLDVCTNRWLGVVQTGRWMNGWGLFVCLI